MNRLIHKISPPTAWKLPVLILLGTFAGVFFYLFYISKAASYLSDDPKTCVNCHVMAPQYATWTHSSHREVAVCNDCHIPHDNFIRHYAFKAQDGLRHATIFTIHSEPQVIQIKEAGIKVVQENCVRCHSDLFNDQKRFAGHFKNTENKLCWDCHRETPHGRVNSLSSTPYAKVPLPKSPVPKWLQEYVKPETQK